jgi:uncharacterized protein YxeA
MPNKNLIYLLIIILLLLIIVPSYLYVKKTHYDNMWLVIDKEVIEAAKTCQTADVCVDNTVTLGFLIQNNYLDKIYDPITKELISDNSYVDLTNDTFNVQN